MNMRIWTELLCGSLLWLLYWPEVYGCQEKSKTGVNAHYTFLSPSLLLPSPVCFPSPQAFPGKADGICQFCNLAKSSCSSLISICPVALWSHVSFLLIKNGKGNKWKGQKVQNNICVRFDWVELHNQMQKETTCCTACGRPIQLFTKACCKCTKFYNSLRKRWISALERTDNLGLIWTWFLLASPPFPAQEPMQEMNGWFLFTSSRLLIHKHLKYPL